MSSNVPTPLPHALSIEVKQTGGTAVVICGGRLTAEHTGALKNAVKPLLSSAKLVQIDLAGVDYIDSAGLGTVVSLYTSARAAHCELKLINFNDQVRNVLHITNLLWVLE